MTRYLANPLPGMLAHYCAGLMEASGNGLTLLDRYSIDRAERRAAGKVGALASYYRQLWIAVPGDLLLLAWPALGYLEIVMAAMLATRGVKTTVIIHETTPLRRQFGGGKLALRLVAPLTRHSNLQVIVHNHQALAILEGAGWSHVACLPHPIRPPKQVRPEHSGLVVRVLGSFKPTRNVGLLHDFAILAPSEWTLEIYGRNWPTQPGWDVHEGFLTDPELERLLGTADLIVIPYSNYDQSGIAVRAFEHGTPVIGFEHEQLADLYGSDWPGMASLTSAQGLVTAGVRVLSIDPHFIVARRDRRIDVTRDSWRPVFGLQKC